MALGIFKALPPYFGGKRGMATQIFRHVPSPAEAPVFVDAFMGGGSVALYAKARGYRVIANDIAERSAIVGRAVIANSTVRLHEDDVRVPLAPHPASDGYVEKTYASDHFLPRHARIIDGALAHARAAANPVRRELLTLSASTAAFVLQVVGYAIVLIFVAVLGIDLSWIGLPAALLALGVLLLLASALGLFVAALRVFVRDVQHLLPTLLMFWFFATPILYAPEMLPDHLRGIATGNPLAWLLGDIRAALFSGQVLPGAATLGALPAAALLFWLALRFYRRLSPHFEDFL